MACIFLPYKLKSVQYTHTLRKGQCDKYSQTKLREQIFRSFPSIPKKSRFGNYSHLHSNQPHWTTIDIDCFWFLNLIGQIESSSGYQHLYLLVAIQELKTVIALGLGRHIPTPESWKEMYRRVKGRSVRKCFRNWKERKFKWRNIFFLRKTVLYLTAKNFHTIVCVLGPVLKCHMKTEQIYDRANDATCSAFCECVKRLVKVAYWRTWLVRGDMNLLSVYSSRIWKIQKVGSVEIPDQNQLK